MYGDNYVEILKEKIKNINDKELINLIEKLISEREHLMHVAKIDPLTGVYNKNILNSIRDCSYLVMCDVDNFKLINDMYGHIKGDYIIKEIAQVILQNFRTKDYVCRFGGDEFLIAVVQCEEQIVLERLENIKDEIRKKNLLPDFEVTLSIGVASACDNDTLNDLIERADIALYESKSLGKNQISIYREQNHIR